MKKILIIYHTQNGNTAKLAKAVRKGTVSVKNTKAIVKKAENATLRDLISCDGIAFGTPDFFSYMAGMLKDFFDRTCYPSEGKITGKPYVAFVSHGGGGDAIKSVEKLCRRFKLKRVAKSLLAEEPHTKKNLKKGYKLGKVLAEKISHG